MKPILIRTAIFTLLIAGCGFFPDNTIPARETVMSPGMKICAEDRGSRICIVAGENYKRTISLDGKTHSINLVPRKERWHGTLGLVSPDRPHDLWKDDEGVVTMDIIQEAEIHYNNVEKIQKRVSSNKRGGASDIFNDNGINIIWKKTYISDTEHVLDVAIFQILINGEKPTSLPGSRNDKICISYEGKGDCD